jgi:eukaryotic-like serine/threonine-protein kinase
MEGVGAHQPSRMLVPVGERVGPFRVVDLLGEGGTGQVFLAHDPRLDRHVALKCVPLTHADPDSTRLILREARTAARVSHPNIAAVYDVLEHGGRMFVVMEHVPGESLAQRLTRGRVPPVDALAIGRQIVSGLEAAHAQGVIHGDLKPANVQLTASGQVKVLDFGIARAIGLTETNITGAATTRRALVRHGAGTPGYMSPEQLVGWTIDERSDIYSAGVVLFELTIGRRPYADDDPLELATRIATTDVPDPSAIDPAVPRMLSDVIRKALAPVPASRFQSARDFGAALARAASEPERPLAGPPQRKRFDIRALYLWAVVLAVIALLSFLAVRWVRRHEPAREQPPSSAPRFLALTGIDARCGSARARRSGRAR